eukprot:TRINITY_DN2594_c0_g3_i1.p1 TRINITY_DN2594_c0_g3~~TRINITY_DN2594_c0_g3_i1.p1  ORF type:complete len:645 (+),score=149.41 TRINITY_DN2594_c0_g3_i1:62-1996(+)
MEEETRALGGSDEEIQENPSSSPLFDRLLQHNRKLKEVLLSMLHATKMAIERNQKLQWSVKRETRFLKDKSLYTFRAAGQEYFTDPAGKTPPKNEDGQNRAWLKMKQPLIYTFKPWTSKELMRLEQGVHQHVLKRLMEDVWRKYPASDPRARREIDEIKSRSHEQLSRFTHDVSWEEVAKDFVTTRRAIECKLQWKNQSGWHLSRAKWTKEEDKRLILLAAKHELCEWDLIADELNTQRSPLQCLTRFQQKLNPNLLRSKWTKEEDEKLHKAVEIYGDSSWQEVANCLDGRVGQQCLHRYEKGVRAGIRRSQWTKEEDKLLIMGVAVYGEGNWSQIAQHVPSRSDVQCRERYVNLLRSDVSMSSWSSEEDERLLNAVREHGVGNWSVIATFMKGRTDNQCWRRWKTLEGGDIVEEYMEAVFKRRTALVKSFVKTGSEKSQLTEDDFEIVEDIEEPRGVRSQFDVSRTARRRMRSQMAKEMVDKELTGDEIEARLGRGVVIRDDRTDVSVPTHESLMDHRVLGLQPARKKSKMVHDEHDADGSGMGRDAYPGMMLHPFMMGHDLDPPHTRREQMEMAVDHGTMLESFYQSNPRASRDLMQSFSARMGVPIIDVQNYFRMREELIMSSALGVSTPTQASEIPKELQ